MNRRPKIELIAPSASPEETAAIAAALEQFMRQTAPPVAPESPRRNPWSRAAMLEATGRAGPSPWGDSTPWG